MLCLLLACFSSSEYSWENRRRFHPPLRLRFWFLNYIHRLREHWNWWLTRPMHKSHGNNRTIRISRSWLFRDTAWVTHSLIQSTARAPNLLQQGENKRKFTMDLLHFSIIMVPQSVYLSTTSMKLNPNCTEWWWVSWNHDKNTLLLTNKRNYSFKSDQISLKKVIKFHRLKIFFSKTT